MRALTLKPCWAWAVAAGGKRIENRTWRPWESVMGERIAIHAGVGDDPAADRLMRRIAKRCGVMPPSSESMSRGAIIATARVVGVLTSSRDPWFTGPLGWVLEDVRGTGFVACRGAQGLWTVPEDVLALILR